MTERKREEESIVRYEWHGWRAWLGMAASLWMLVSGLYTLALIVRRLVG